ncbi:MAG: substrate-binding domain-containing protein [Spirochaetes bacterium]|nr:substrate-binding domain-containing protein [Spirochaetota bacterium]
MLVRDAVTLLQGRITSGAWRSGERLPGIRELSREMGASYVTLQKALKALTRQGLVTAERAQGCFVTRAGIGRTIQAMGARELLYLFADPLRNPPAEYQLSLYQHFQALVRAQGFLDRLAPPGELPGTPAEPLPAGALATEEDLQAKRLAAQGIPIVYCTSLPILGSGCAVNPDFHGGCAQATRHLLQLGHRRIGFITSADVSELPQLRQTFALREQGYRDALEAAGQQAASAVAWHHRAPQAVRALLTGPQRPTALVVANDVMAVELLSLAQELGLQVPRDLSVVGLEDMRCGRTSSPALTTVGYDHAALAQAAVGLLLELIAGHVNGCVHKTIPMKLVPRASAQKPNLKSARSQP